MCEGREPSRAQGLWTAGQGGGPPAKALQGLEKQTGWTLCVLQALKPCSGGRRGRTLNSRMLLCFCFALLNFLYKILTMHFTDRRFLERRTSIREESGVFLQKALKKEKEKFNDKILFC